MTPIEVLREAIEKPPTKDFPGFDHVVLNRLVATGRARAGVFVVMGLATARALLADLEELEAYRRRIGPFLQGIADGQHEYEVGWHVAQIEETEGLLYELSSPAETPAKLKEGEG